MTWAANSCFANTHLNARNRNTKNITLDVAKMIEILLSFDARWRHIIIIVPTSANITKDANDIS